MKYPLYLVTGAPGSGKSTTLEAFLKLDSEYIAFDIDWLAETASNLADRNIFVDRSTWKPYNVLWYEVLHGVYKNGKTPILFTPNDPQDMERYGQPAWCGSVNWLLLDCDDQTRVGRLKHRVGWTEAMIAEAIVDAQVLREAVGLQIDTGLLSPQVVAAKILAWLEG